MHWKSNVPTDDDRFAEDIQLMTGKRPHIYWMICWKYVSPSAMVIILTASWIKIFTEGESGRPYMNKYLYN